MFFAYMLRCRDGSLYSGYTNNIDSRVKTHNIGRGAKYTRTRLPVSLAYYEEFEQKSEAMSREYAFKHMTKLQKENLIIQSSFNSK